MGALRKTSELAGKVSVEQGSRWAWYAAFFLLGFVAAKIFSPTVWWCIPAA